MRWVFVGAGNMAASMAGGLLAAGTDSASIALVDPDDAARKRIGERHAVTTAATIEALWQSDVGSRGGSSAQARGSARGSARDETGVAYVIAVKPNIVEAACRAIASAGTTTPLVVSVAAGVRMNALAAWLPTGTPIVRCMPNTPALLGLGASGLFANTACSDQDRQAADTLLTAAGSTHWVDDETLLDAVTATSGSGPAYFFYLIEQMAAAGTALGLDADTARELAIDTAFGAASMARARDVPPDELRRRVTSKGGTTAAALAAFESAGFPDIVHEAMRAAHRRAVELGDEYRPESVESGSGQPGSGQPGSAQPD